MKKSLAATITPLSEQAFVGCGKIKGRTLREMRKLRALKNSVRIWNSSYQKSRRMKVSLCRLRIGHSRLTHRYLMEHRPMPYCNDCLVPLTVMHVIAECPNYAADRRNCFPDTVVLNPDETLARMLKETPRTNFRTDSLKQYLTQCNLLREL